MIFPLFPVFLTQVLALGAGSAAVALGTIEGAAEFVASMLKIASGMLADRMSRRKPLVAAGYSFSGLMRPLIGLAASWPWVLVFRVADRIGKGVRTSPRDALIADVTDENLREWHTAFSSARQRGSGGRTAGRCGASGDSHASLVEQSHALRLVFLLAFIPAVAVVTILILFVKESSVHREPRKSISLETGGGSEADITDSCWRYSYLHLAIRQTRSCF